MLHTHETFFIKFRRHTLYDIGLATISWHTLRHNVENGPALESPGPFTVLVLDLQDKTFLSGNEGSKRI